MKKNTRNTIGMFILFILISIPGLVCAEEKALPVSISPDEVLMWKEKHLIDRLANGMYVIKFTNPDAKAEVKEVFGVVEMVLTQATPTFEITPVLRLYAYEQNKILYRFIYENGLYVGGPVKLPSMQEDDPDDEESGEPLDSKPVPQPPPSKGKEVRSGGGVIMLGSM